MFEAIDTADGTLHYAGTLDESARARSWICRFCKVKAFPVLPSKLGPIGDVLERRRHFRHKSNSDRQCKTAGETELHIAAKYKVRDTLRLRGYRAEVEQTIDPLRPDVIAWMAGTPPIAVEIQHSPISCDEIVKKIGHYTQLGLATWYIVSNSRVPSGGKAKRIDDWVRLLNELYGHVSVTDGEKIWPVALKRKYITETMAWGRKVRLKRPPKEGRPFTHALIPYQPQRDTRHYEPPYTFLLTAPHGFAKWTWDDDWRETYRCATDFLVNRLARDEYVIRLVEPWSDGMNLLGRPSLVDTKGVSRVLGICPEHRVRDTGWSGDKVAVMSPWGPAILDYIDVDPEEEPGYHLLDIFDHQWYWSANNSLWQRPTPSTSVEGLWGDAIPRRQNQ